MISGLAHGGGCPQTWHREPLAPTASRDPGGGCRARRGAPSASSAGSGARNDGTSVCSPSGYEPGLHGASHRVHARWPPVAAGRPLWPSSSSCERPHGLPMSVSQALRAPARFRPTGAHGRSSSGLVTAPRTRSQDRASAPRLSTKGELVEQGLQLRRQSSTCGRNPAARVISDEGGCGWGVLRRCEIGSGVQICGKGVPGPFVVSGRWCDSKDSSRPVGCVEGLCCRSGHVAGREGVSGRA